MNRNRVLKGFIVLILGMIFARVETYYFGNNMYPQSWPEVICDSICLIFYGWGIYLIVVDK